MIGEFLPALLIVLWLIGGPIIALVMACRARTQARETHAKLHLLEAELHGLRQELRLRLGSAAPQAPLPQAEIPDRADLSDQSDGLVESATPLLTSVSFSPCFATPPAIPRAAAAPPKTASFTPVEPTEPSIPFSLEQFMGVKLFAWLGGIALFFGVIFFVKYAFENNLIPAAVRVALGFLTGIGLLVGGLALHRKAAYQVLAQAFFATGVLILYGVTYAARALYHLAAFGDGPTFALMTLITVVAFLLAVRLNALVVAALGMLGGFLTPVLVQTAKDNPLGLFSYIALLVIGLIAVSRHHRWAFLVTAAAVGTVMTQLLWFGKFFVVGHYAEGTKIFIPLGILVFYNALFVAAAWLEQRRGEPLLHAPKSALGLCAVSLIFAYTMLSFTAVATRVPLLYGFILLENLALLAVVWLQPRLIAAQVCNALLTFLHLAIWTSSYLNADRLPITLAASLVFGALHAVVPVLLIRLRPDGMAVVPSKVWSWSAPLTLLLVLVAILHLPGSSLLVWPAVLLMDLLVILLALLTGAMLPILGSLILSLVLAAAWLLHAPIPIHSLSPFLFIITGFAAVFAGAGNWLLGKPALAEDSAAGQPTLDRQVAQILPMFSGALPFALLILAIVQLPIANPSPVFGVGLLMVVLLLGLALLNRQSALVPTALGCILAVEFVWHGHRFDAATPNIPLAWYLGFYGLFLVFPFVFRKAFISCIWPWTTSALAAIGHFLLVHHLIGRAFPQMAGMMGLLPAAFALPSLLALVVLLRTATTIAGVDRAKVAWFGGVALFFITLIFPIQFDRQWLTVSWALEGACLLWLFRRVSHPGLQLTGLGLLVVAFVRLAINPAVFTDYPRSGTAIFNWHLYTYGIVAAAQMLGAWWFSDPAGRLREVKARSILLAFAGVLFFLLMNIEIADLFAPPGSSCVAFDFGLNFARDMTYSLAWGLFSLGLLGLGLWRHARPARYAAIALLVVTLLKLFIHDLSAIGSIFRIGALIGGAIIAFTASFLYQQFFSRSQPSCKPASPSRFSR